MHHILLLVACVWRKPGFTCTFSSYLRNSSRILPPLVNFWWAHILGVTPCRTLRRFLSSWSFWSRCPVRWQELFSVVGSPQGLAQQCLKGTPHHHPKISPRLMTEVWNAVGERREHSTAFLDLQLFTCKLIWSKFVSIISLIFEVLGCSFIPMLRDYLPLIHTSVLQAVLIHLFHRISLSVGSVFKFESLLRWDLRRGWKAWRNWGMGLGLE